MFINIRRLLRTCSLLLPFALLLPTTHAVAAICDITAPGFDHGSDAYYELYMGKPVEQNTQQEIRSLTRKLQGKWSGVLVETTCLGGGETKREKIENFDVDARISKDYSGLLALRAEKTQKRHVTLEDLIVLSPGERKTYRKSFKGKPAASYVVTPSDSELFFAEKARVTRISGFGRTGSRLVHQINELRLEGDQLIIERHIYINGSFASREEWALERG